MTKKQCLSYSLLLLCIISLALSFGAGLLYKNIQIVFIEKLSTVLFCVAVIIAGFMLVNWLLSNRIYKGFRYFWYHWRINKSLENQLIDAGICIDRGKYFELPQMKLSFDRDFRKGILKIRNSIKFDKKYDAIVMSAALGSYAVERHYTTDDGNYYLYELINGTTSYKLTFKSYQQFQKYNKRYTAYELFLDKRSSVKLQHTLIVGQTGSGKSYQLYNMILQMINKPVPYNLYFVDPKASSIAVVGEILAPERTAVNLTETIELLESFVEKMRERKAEIKQLLKTKLDSDYASFGLSPLVLIFDEYASFSAVLASEEKKTRDKVKALLTEIVLQGRQLGAFVFLLLQKAGAESLDTAIRENLPLKLCLGNAEHQTYVTAFGTGVDIPNRHYKVGEGVFTEPTLASEPKLVQCPFCDFDILSAMKSTTPVL